MIVVVNPHTGQTAIIQNVLTAWNQMREWSTFHRRAWAYIRVGDEFTFEPSRYTSFCDFVIKYRGLADAA